MAAPARAPRVSPARKPHTPSSVPEPSAPIPTLSSPGPPPAAGPQAGPKDSDPENRNEKILHEALDSAVRHALEDAWQLPPHAPAHGKGVAVGSDPEAGETVAGQGGEEGGEAPARERTLAELYAELDDLGISAHELNEVLEEAMRATGDR